MEHRQHSVNPSAIPAHSRTPLRAAPPSHTTLSPAEHLVFRKLLAGYSHTEIAREAGKSRRTVDAQKAHVFRKLGITRRHELVTYAIGAGLMRAEW